MTNYSLGQVALGELLLQPPPQDFSAFFSSQGRKAAIDPWQQSPPPQVTTPAATVYAPFFEALRLRKVPEANWPAIAFSFAAFGTYESTPFAGQPRRLPTGAEWWSAFADASATFAPVIPFPFLYFDQPSGKRAAQAWSYSQPEPFVVTSAFTPSPFEQPQRRAPPIDWQGVSTSAVGAAFSPERWFDGLPGRRRQADWQGVSASVISAAFPPGQWFDRQSLLAKRQLADWAYTPAFTAQVVVTATYESTGFELSTKRIASNSAEWWNMFAVQATQVTPAQVFEWLIRARRRGRR